MKSETYDMLYNYISDLRKYKIADEQKEADEIIRVINQLRHDEKTKDMSDKELVETLETQHGIKQSIESFFLSIYLFVFLLTIISVSYCGFRIAGENLNFMQIIIEFLKSIRLIFGIPLFVIIFSLVVSKTIIEIIRAIKLFPQIVLDFFSEYDKVTA